MPKKNQNRNVIFASPGQLKGENQYISWEGKRTKLKLEAAFFNGHGFAKEWAKDNGIDLTGAIPYIGEVDFSEHDISSNYGSRKRMKN